MGACHFWVKSDRHPSSLYHDRLDEMLGSYNKKEISLLF